ncbi:MAG TPA: hypothetical protein VF111_01490 [Thermoanaerobaculia bacterium]
MAGRLWSIMIVQSTSGGPAQFVPDIPNPTLQAQPNDLLCWNNQTNDTHQPTVDGSGEAFDKIPPGKSSEKSYEIPTAAEPGTLVYYCAIHPQETGTVQVIE